MNKTKIIIFLLTVMFFNKLICQNSTFELEFIKFKQKVETSFINNIDKMNVNDYQIIPFVSIPDYCQIDSSKLIESIVIDTTLCYIVISKNNRYYGILGKMPLPIDEYLTYDVKEAPFFDPVFEFIEYGNLYSKNLFFFSTDRREKYNKHFLGYIKEHKVNLIDRDLKQYKTIDSVLIEIYGSVEKYCEIIKDRQKKDSLYGTINIEMAKKIISKSYEKRSFYCPKDTLGALNLFLEGLDLSINLKPSQRVLLENKIITMLRKSQIIDFCGSGIPFLGKDLSMATFSVLTKEQYYNYLKNRDEYSLKLNCAGKKLYYYYRHDCNIPNDSIDIIFENIVSGALIDD